MKKVIFFLFAAVYGITALDAQLNSKTFFPTTEGTTLVNKTYDGNGNPVATTVYTVLHTDTDEYRQGDSEVRYVMMDAQDRVTAQGVIETILDQDHFRMNIKNSGIMPDPLKTLSLHTELVGDFLDYPNTFADMDGFAGMFDTNSGEYAIETDKGAFYRVRIENRLFSENETISIPAGEFDSSKSTFNVIVTDEDGVRHFTGEEWYSYGAGIIQTRIYDENKDLISRTVLTEITNNPRF